jgi:hypothetical protein
MRMVLVLLGLLATLAGASAEDRSVVRFYPACKSVVDFARIISIVAAKDDKAFQRFAEQKFVTDECINLITGTVVAIDTTDQMGHVCARPQGKTQCYWTDLAAFEIERKPGWEAR